MHQWHKCKKITIKKNIPETCKTYIARDPINMDHAKDAKLTSLKPTIFNKGRITSVQHDLQLKILL